MRTNRRLGLLSWSSGKDSAWALHTLRKSGEVEVVGLLTTVNDAYDRVAMHAVRRELLEAQSQATGIRLWTVPMPPSCSNVLYDEALGGAMKIGWCEGCDHV